MYDAELAYLDSRIGQLHTFLQQNGLLDETILIITSDHGENLGDHNLMDHQYCVYDTLARVPLIIRYPDIFPGGLQVSALVQTTDLFPSLAEILAVADDPVLSRVQGQSLLPERIAVSPREYAVTEYLAPQLHSFRREDVSFDSKFSRQLRAINTGRYKYIWASNGENELYDLQTDPGELCNIIADEPETAVCLATELQTWVDQHTLPGDDEGLVDEAIVNRLEALGYI